MNKFSIFLLVLIFSGCSTDTDEEIQDISDDIGNLVIINNTEEKLVLYNGDDAIRIIPNTSNEFLVGIDNENNIVLDLRIFKYDDVIDDINSADDGLLYKRWNVILAENFEQEYQVTWVIQKESTEAESGTVTFDYAPGSEYSVDIFLNSKTGARLLSLAPGWGSKKAGIDYGNYQLYYHYWYSDPNSAEGIQSIGWISLNDEDIQFSTGISTDQLSMVINVNNNDIYKVVPMIDFEQPEINGSIIINNSSSNILKIYIGNTLIELHENVSGMQENSSTIPRYSTSEFVLLGGEYQLYARDAWNYEMLIDELNITVQPDTTYEWNISD